MFLKTNILKKVKEQHNNRINIMFHYLLATWQTHWSCCSIGWTRSNIVCISCILYTSYWPIVETSFQILTIHCILMRSLVIFWCITINWIFFCSMISGGTSSTGTILGWSFLLFTMQCHYWCFLPVTRWAYVSMKRHRFIPNAWISSFSSFCWCFEFKIS